MPSSTRLLTFALLPLFLACPKPTQKIDSGAQVVCGDGRREGKELCDDGNNNNDDACKNDCTLGQVAAYCGDGARNASEACDDGNAIAGDGCEADCTVSVEAPSGSACGDAVRQGEEECDDGNLTAGDGCEPDCSRTSPLTVTCPAASGSTNADSCDVVAGGENRLFVGTVLLPGKVLQGGQVLVTADGGNIVCVSCDCAARDEFATATQVLCGKNVISPGLINSHDHITFTAAPYFGNWTDAGMLLDGGIPERYEHRHDWRVGGGTHEGHFSIPSGGTGGADAILWSELRQVMAGTTSIAGSGGAVGLLRNLDKADTSPTAASQMGLGANERGALYDTFPLKDSSGTELSESCKYSAVPNAGIVPEQAAYLPHIAEGIERSARNEFLCLSGVLDGGSGVFTPRTGMIHGIALKPADIRFIAEKKSSLIWSPRSNISLYGETAQVSTYTRARANIAMGSDWLRSGSMNILRELQCADYLNANFFQKTLSDESLWKMATQNGARALAVSQRTGVLAVGHAADIAIYKYRDGNPYRSVIASHPKDVLLTFRGGTPLYGAQNVVSGLATGCDTLDVCGSQKSVCLADSNTDLATLTSKNSKSYALVFCDGAPPTEPVCTPMRSGAWLFSGANAYSGIAVTGTDSDGDGIPDTSDNCPNHFNPIRPKDNGTQADADKDGKGDACDICPLNANTNKCAMFNESDADGDGVPNVSDKCPMDPDANQTDTDSDGKGDVCDECPTQANPGVAVCPPPPGTVATISQIKMGAATGKVQVVDVIVTGVAGSGFFIQDPRATSPDYSGVFVYAPSPLPRTDIKVGDKVTIVSGTVQNFFNQIQISGILTGALKVLSSNNALPTPTLVTPAEVATGGSRAAALEGVLIRLENVTVAQVKPPPDMGDTAPTHEFTVQKLPDNTELRVNDLFWAIAPFPTVGEPMGFIQGILEWRNNNSKIEPRGESDMQRPVALVSIGPGGQFVRQGAAPGPTFPQALKVRLNSTQPADTVVSLSTDGGITLPPSVLISAGKLEAEIPVQGAQPELSAVVSATLDGGTILSSTVRVAGTSETPRLSACQPNPLLLPEGGTADLTVVLDIPPASAATIALESDAGFATVPASVQVAANSLSTTFQVAAARDASGLGSIVANLGASSLSCPVKVTNLPTTSHVVISELKVDGANVNDEFVEIYNPTSQEVDLSGWKIQYKSATGTTYQNSGEFPAGAKIGPRGYFLFVSGAAGLTNDGYMGATKPDAVRNSSTGPSPFSFSGTAGHVRIGPNDLGTAISDAKAVDTVGYGSTASAPEGGAAAPSPGKNSIERKANGNATEASMANGGDDALLGNSQDSDNNAADFVPRAVAEPQNRASPTEP